jgi:DNA-binding NtrC family response regulator
MSIEKPKVIVIDNDQRVCDYVARVLKTINVEALCYYDPEECLKSLRGLAADILLVDFKMPKVDGLAILKEAKKANPYCQVIIISAYADKILALEAIKSDAYDIIEKPLEDLELIETFRRARRYQLLASEKRDIEHQLLNLSNSLADKWGINALIGDSKAMKDIRNEIDRIAKANSTSVFILGESGTGKELAAHAIHIGSKRAAKPFVPVNCASIPRELAESILFGHVKGSFTGATNNSDGAFVNADGGTLFLDEIGDMPLSIQPKLLRVLEDKTVIPVGKTDGTKVDVRVIAASNVDIRKKVEAKEFREDLYYRISAYTIHIPPLRERREDIPVLLDYYLSRYCEEMSLPHISLSDDLKVQLCKYDYHGNIRELKNIVERALINMTGNTLELPDFKLSRQNNAIESGNAVGNHPNSLEEVIELHIRRILDETKGNVSLAASLMQITRARLYRYLEKLGIPN